jgi:F-type H+-transporting ATPase subunit epsilon
MTAFVVELLSPGASARMDDVINFVGADASGQFGLRARHEPFITVLLPGLARLQHGSGAWDYLAQPGATLHFADNRLTVAARDYVLSSDHRLVLDALQQRFASEDATLAAVRENLIQLEREMFRRLWDLERSAT